MCASGLEVAYLGPGQLTERVNWRPPMRAASLVRLRALRWRSETNNGFAIETRKRVELRTIFVRLAAQHCNPAQRAMPNRRSRRSGHWGHDFEADVLPTCLARAGTDPPSTMWRPRCKKLPRSARPR